MTLRLLALSGLLCLTVTGCANKDAEEPYTPATNSYGGNYATTGGSTTSSVYTNSGSGTYGGGPSATYTSSPTPQPAPGGLEKYPASKFNDYTEEQADTYTTGSSDGTFTTVNRRTGAVSSGGGNGPTNYVGSGGTYVVAKGDTLFELARRFYRDEARWRDIWNANRARVPNRDRLPIGIKLIIP